MAGLDLSGQRKGGNVLASLLLVGLESRAKDGIEVGARSGWGGCGRHYDPGKGYSDERVKRKCCVRGAPVGARRGNAHVTLEVQHWRVCALPLERSPWPRP